MNNTYVYIGLMALTTFATRAVPIFLFKKKIENRFIQSFLHYVPYVTLAVMTFPAILEATDSPLAGLVSFILGILAAWYSGNLFVVSGVCCLSVFILSLF